MVRGTLRILKNEAGLLWFERNWVRVNWVNPNPLLYITKSHSEMDPDYLFKAHLMMSDEVHDYSEIYTPSTEVKGVVHIEDREGPTTTASTTSMSSSIETSAQHQQVGVVSNHSF